MEINENGVGWHPARMNLFSRFHYFLIANLMAYANVYVRLSWKQAVSSMLSICFLIFSNYHLFHVWGYSSNSCMATQIIESTMKNFGKEHHNDDITKTWNPLEFYGENDIVFFRVQNNNVGKHAKSTLHLSRRDYPRF